MSLGDLPSELYYCILSHVPPSSRQVTTLNLSRAIPLSPVPLHPLFEHIVISRQEQVFQLYRRLRYAPTPKDTLGNETHDKERAWIKSLTFRTWQVDADITINLLGLLTGIENLSLLVGTTFSPEHLEEIFHTQIITLNTLSVRFRPYVQRATYYQFLKGSYFDGSLELLSRWPHNPRLTRLSIIQDPLPPPSVESPAKSFAQPIVFFSLAPLTTLSLSHAVRNITYLRLRIPSRQIVRFITSKGSVASTTSNFPSLIFIDLSTSTVREFSEVEALLIHTGHGRLKHMVLDNTGLCGGNEGEWESLGRSCALAGVRRMREREKALKAWLESQHATISDGHDVADPRNNLPDAAQVRRPRRGRRGLATATISLRDTVQGSSPAAHPGVRHGTQSTRASAAGKIRVLPSPPCLMSLSITLSRPLAHTNLNDLRAHEIKARSDFAKGWSEGLAQIRAIWTRLRQSQSNGVRVVRFDENVVELGAETEMFEGLTDMGKPDDDAYWEKLQDVELPILCFAGSRDEEVSKHQLGQEWPDHPEGCGHRIAWDVWGNNS